MALQIRDSDVRKHGMRYEHLIFSVEFGSRRY